MRPKVMLFDEVTSALDPDFFSGGKIVEQGPPSQIFGAPENERTRQFLSAVMEAT
jgi:polar amino acid transport system ATP-binding protein